MAPILRKSAARLVRSYSVADDLVQDVAVLALRLGVQFDFDSQEAFQRWALRRIRWYALDYLKNSMRLVTIGDGAQLEFSSAEGADPMNAAATTRAITDALNALPPRQRAVATRKLQGEVNSEIASHLKITESTVRSLWRFARQRMVSEWPDN